MSGLRESGVVDTLISSGHEPRIFSVGNEQTPVIVIDNFLTETQYLIDLAVDDAVFSSGQRTAYPGVRSALPEPFMCAAIAAVTPVIQQTYALPKKSTLGKYHGYYSLVATLEEQLGVLQRLPHCDTRRPYYFAILLYLNPGVHGGTGFYRHNPTGFERLGEQSFYHYVKAAESFMQDNGLPAEQYYQADDGHFCLIGSVDYLPNRAVIYPGNLLHSGLIKPELDVNNNPCDGRLTANIFVDFEEL